LNDLYCYAEGEAIEQREELERERKEKVERPRTCDEWSRCVSFDPTLKDRRSAVSTKKCSKRVFMTDARLYAGSPRADGDLAPDWLECPFCYTPQ